MPPCHCVTASLCQAFICFAPCHQTSQSFALSPATKPVSHLPCPLPPNQSVIWLAPCHQTSQSFDLPYTTVSPRHCIPTSLHHHVSQSFALPPATKPVSHLPCSLPPNQSVIWLAPCHQTSQSVDLPSTTASPHHRITVSPCHHVSQSFALPPATKPVSHLPCPPATKPVSHLSCPLPPNQSVSWLALYHHVTTSPHHHVTTSPCHCVSQSFALPPATKAVSQLPCPLPPNQSISWLALYHCVTASLCHCITASPHHHITASPHHHVTVSQCQSLICLAPCHQASHSFALSPATKPVSHLPCPLPPNQSVSWLAIYHHLTASPCHWITVWVSHLPCLLPPNHSVICLAPCHQTSQSFDLPSTTVSLHHRITTSPHHHVTAPPHHHITMSPRHNVSESFALPPATKPVSHLPCPLPTKNSVICLAPCHQTSQSVDLHSTTVSPCHHATTSPCHRITMSLYHHVSQSFALPPATKPVSYLPYPLPPNQSVIWLALYHHITTSPCHHITASLCHCTTMSLHHHITMSQCQSVICLVPCHKTSQSFALSPATKPVSHLPCPLPPNQSVICLTPCHQTSQHLTCPLPPHHHITMPPHHRITVSLHHHVTASPHHHVTMSVSHLPCPLPQNQSVICLAPCHQTSQSFALPPATKPVSHLPCPLPPNQSVSWLALYQHLTASPCHHVTVSVSHLPSLVPPNQSVIWLAPCHQTSQSVDLPSTTVLPHHCITTSLHHCITMSPHHHITMSPHHCVTT